MTTTDDVEQTVALIAQDLGETEEQPVTTIRRIVNQFGADFAHQVLQETARVEEQGGLMLPDKSRKRTRGGVFFYLVRGRISRKDIFTIFYSDQPRQQKKEKEAPFNWKDRLEIAHELSHQPGEAKVKMTLIGRPGKVVEKRQFVITMVRDTKVPPLPKGLPVPPEKPTSYMVYISKKQWNRVKEAIQDPDDVLVIEGFARYDPELEGIAVFATNTMTKLLQQKQREEQKKEQEQAG
jgi:hypothetical protein